MGLPTLTTENVVYALIGGFRGMYEGKRRSIVEIEDENIHSAWVFEDSLGKAVEISLVDWAGTVFLSLDELKQLVAELESLRHSIPA